MNPTIPRRVSLIGSFGFAVAVLLAASIAQAGTAQDEKDFGRPGFYIGAAGSYTHNFFDDQIDDAFEDLVPAKVDVDIDDSFGISARVGYRVASFIAFELQYEWIDNFKTEVTSPAFSGAKATIDITGHALTLNTKLIAPLWRIQPYLLVGAGYALYDSDTNSVAKALGIKGGDESGFAGRLGGGIDWYLTRNLVLATDVTVLLTTQDFKQPDTGDVDNLYYLSMSAGLQWRF